MFGIHKVRIISNTYIQQFFPCRITKYIDIFYELLLTFKPVSFKPFLEMKKSRETVMQYCLKFDYLKCINRLNLIHIIEIDLFEMNENIKRNS